MKKVIFLFVIGFFISINLHSQTWTKAFGGNSDDRAYEVIELNDGNFLVTGYTESFGNGGKDVSVLKLDINGNIIWSKVIGGNSDEVAYSAVQIISGEIFLAGFTDSYGSGGNDVYLIKLSETGNTIWEKTYGGINDELCNSIKSTLNGNLILIGKTNSLGYGLNDIYVLEINTDGILLWENTYGFNNNDVGHDIEQLPDSSFIICGQSEFVYNHWFVSRLNSSGDTLWQKTIDYGASGIYCTFGSNSNAGIAEATSVVLVDDSLFYIAGKGYNGSGFAWCTRWIVRKMDINGNTIWNESPYNYATKSMYAADLALDSGIVLIGMDDNYEDNVKISKLDSDGNTIFQNNYLQNGLKMSYGVDIKVCENGSFISCGYQDLIGAPSSAGLNNYNMFVIKTDANGQWTNNLNKIEGVVELDTTYYPSGIGIANQVIKFNDLYPDTSMWVADSFYTHTDANGNYSVFADTGSYKISYTAHHPYYLLDPILGEYQVDFPTYQLLEDNINFYDSVIYQPHGVVNISSGLHRPCQTGYYNITYQNNGYLPMEDVQIVVEYNPNVIITSSIPPWSFIDSDSIVFYIDTLQPFETGSIIIYDSVVCETELTNNTVCAYASIYGSNITNTPGPSWDQSSVSVDGSCYTYGSTDSVRFVIYNNGNDMLTSSEYRIYENNSLVIQNTFQLNAGDSLVIMLFSVGHTYRLEADQHPDHPGNSHPRITIENCGEFFGVPGLVYSVPYDDYAIDNAWVCNTLVNSYDPNYKEVYPTGISSENYISHETPYLNYYVHFQNTGTAVAYNVTIKDTISPFLDITTIDIISSSHDYTWDLYGPGIVQFTFDNINLPDSNVNEPESHGYINYKINLRDSLPDYTIVENEAYIFFDYNEAILTNTVFHTIYDTILTPVPYSIQYDTICGNDSIFLQSLWRKDSGIYYDTVNTGYGDSLIATKLHVKSSFLDEENQYICNGDSAFWRGNYYKNTGQFTESFTNIYNCDSTYLMNLTVYPDYLNFESETICSNDSISFGGQYYNQTGVYYDSLLSMNGCDSVIELTLNVNPSISHIISEDIEICEDDSTYWQGNYFDSTGIYSITYTSAFGCDSIRELNLTVHQKYYDHMVLEVCQGDSVLWEGNYYSVAGNYSETLTTINNCDSIREMSLIVNPNPIVDSILGTDTVDLYQTELYYILNDSLIYYWNVESGTIMQQIAGNVVQIQWDSLGIGHIYVVAENQYGCFSDTTIMDIIIGTTHLNIASFENKLIIYPNPTTGEFSIIVDGFIRAEIFNNLGQKLLVSDKMKINACNLSSGIYYVKVLTGRGSITGKILKK